MLELMTVSLAVGATVLATLKTVYWICTILGGGLLVVSTATGGDAGGDVDVDVDADFDADLDADLDADVGVDTDVSVEDLGHVEAGHAGAAGVGAGHGGALALWGGFSVRFVVLCMAVCGVVGVVLTYLSNVNAALTFGIALVAGVAVGQVVHQLVRMLKRTSGDSTPRPQDYVNKLARVTIPFAQPNQGEIALQVRPTRRPVPAVAPRCGAGVGRGGPPAAGAPPACRGWCAGAPGRLHGARACAHTEARAARVAGLARRPRSLPAPLLPDAVLTESTPGGRAEATGSAPDENPYGKGASG